MCVLNKSKWCGENEENITCARQASSTTTTTNTSLGGKHCNIKLERGERKVVAPTTIATTDTFGNTACRPACHTRTSVCTFTYLMR